MTGAVSVPVIVEATRVVATGASGTSADLVAILKLTEIVVGPGLGPFSHPE